MKSDEWKEVRLGDVITSISETFKDEALNVVLINTSDIYNGYVINHDFVKNTKLKGQFKKKFQKKDILYSEIRPQNKRFAFVDFDPKHYIASTKLMVLRKACDNIDIKYIYHLLKSDEIINELQIIAESRSGTFPQITFKELSDLKIYLPPLPEQKAIADILSCIDNKIENNNRMNKVLEEMAQAIFKSWFIDFEPFKDGEFVDSELGMIPKGWRVGTLNEFYEVNIGKTPPRKEQQWFKKQNSGIKWVSISDMGSNGMYIYKTHECLTKEAIDRFKIKLIPENSVLLSFKLTVGRVSITSHEMTSNEAIAHIICKDISHLEYVYIYLKNFNFDTLGSTSSIANATNSKTVKQLPFLMPTTNLLKDFNNIILPIFHNIKSNLEELNNLTSLRDTLLPKLMSGEIRVPYEKE